MANNYTIDFTDKSDNRRFQLNAYTTNGPENPTTNTLDDKAASAATSLLLHGKGSPNYGERIQEDILHTMEHFAGSVEPTYPIGGQVWFDRSTVPYVLRVFNTHKHIITVNAPPNNSLINFITISGDETSRLVPGNRMRVIDADGTGLAKDAQKEFLIFTSVLDVNGNTAISILPAPATPLTGHYVGGWEYLLQNNSGLFDDFSANGFSIINLATPFLATDAATKGYVDTQITAHNELGEMTDVIITAPVMGSALIFDGAFWRNQTGAAAGFLSLTGGNMTGQIDMGTNLIRSVLDPVAAQDAATKGYVDSSAASITANIPTLIVDLTDVIYGGPIASDDLLQFDGAVWTNVGASTLLLNAGALFTTGGTMSGNLFLNSNPTTNLQAATKQYVDAELAGAISASGDGVVNGGFFDNINQELTLTRTNGLPMVVVSGFAAGGTTTDAVFHQVGRSTDFQGMVDLFFERAFYNNPAFPNLPLDDMLGELNKMLGNLITKPGRTILASKGVAAVDIGNDSTGTHGDVGLDYVPGFSNLSVFVNGVKQYADEHGFLDVNATMGITNPATDTDQLWPGVPTGLSSVVTYAFQIQLNAGNASDSGVITVLINGANAQNMGLLVQEMLLFSDLNLINFNGQSTDSIPPFGVLLEDAHLTFYSSFPGADSSVTLIDGDGGTNTPLFAAIIGGADAANRTYTYTIPSASINSGKANIGAGNPGISPPAPSTWGYREIGRVGRASTKIVFSSGNIPPVATPIEFNVSTVPFYERTIQP